MLAFLEYNYFFWILYMKMLMIWYLEPLSMVFWTPTDSISNPLPMVFWSSYLWYIENPTHAIKNPLTMLYWNPYHSILNPLPIVYWKLYPWYFDPTTHDMSSPSLSMVFRTPYTWYMEPPTHGVSNPLLVVFRSPYSLYIELHTNGISNPLSWYIELPTHDILTPSYGISNPLPISCLEMRGFNLPYKGGGQFLIRVFNITWMKIDSSVNIPWGSKFHMAPRVKISSKIMKRHW